MTVSDDTSTVTEINVKTSIDRGFRIRPKTTVLAAGGIDNARLLLLSNQQVAAGIGNQHDLVGRYFADHIWYRSGFILPIDQDPASVKIYQKEIPFEDDYSIRCHLALPEARAREFRIPQFRAELDIQKTYRFHDSVDSYLRVRRHVEDFDFAQLSFEDVLDLIRDPGPVLRYRDGDDGPLVYGLVNYVEPVPNPESRVRLSSETDALGIYRPELRWQLSDLDKEGIIKSQHAIATEVGRAGIGRAQIVIPKAEATILDGATGGAHHMGTTRMHVDPKRGVVDANARVHGMSNLFIAGSSIFPSYGFANPTLTIVALSLRLADYLKASVLNAA